MHEMVTIHMDTVMSEVKHEEMDQEQSVLSVWNFSELTTKVIECYFIYIQY